MSQTLHPSIQMHCLRRGDRLVYRLKTPAGRWHEIGAREAAFLDDADRRSDSAPWAVTLNRWAKDAGIFIDHPSPSPKPDALGGRWNPLLIRIPIPGGRRWMTTVADQLRPLASRPVVGIAALAIMITLVTMWICRDRWTVGTAGLLTPSMAAWLLIVWVSLKACHEVGHAIACRRMNCAIGEVGVCLMMFTPVAYIDVSDGWSLPSRVDRFAVAGAGLFVEWVITAAAFWVALLTDDPSIRVHAVAIVATAGFTTLMGNANFLMRLDGYHMLCDALDTPNLASTASRRVAAQCRRWIGIKTRQDDDRSGASVGYLLYGWAALIWRFVIAVSVVALADYFGSTPAMLLATMLVTPWFASAPIRLAIELWQGRHDAAGPGLAPLIRMSLMLVALAATWFWLPVGPASSAVAIKVAEPRSVVRSPLLGEIESWQIVDGTRVKSGDVIATLRRPDLLMRRDELQIELTMDQQRIASATAAGQRSDRTAAIASRRENAEALSTVQRELNDCIIVAPIDGVVYAADPDIMDGRWVQHGQTIATVDSGGPSQFVAYLTPRQASQPMIRVGGRLQMDDSQIDAVGTVTAIVPGASRSLDHPALGAVGGGPLAIRQYAGGKGAELVRPMVRVRLKTNATQNPPIGYRTRVRLNGDRPTPHRRFVQWYGRMLGRMTADS